MRCLPAESKADAVLHCRDKKAAVAGEKAGSKPADRGAAKQAVQQGIPDKADAKLSFGRIEVDKGKATCVEPVAMVLGSPSPSPVPQCALLISTWQEWIGFCMLGPGMLCMIVGCCTAPWSVDLPSACVPVIKTWVPHCGPHIAAHSGGPAAGHRPGRNKDARRGKPEKSKAELLETAKQRQEQLKSLEGTREGRVR